MQPLVIWGRIAIERILTILRWTRQPFSLSSNGFLHEIEIYPDYFDVNYAERLRRQAKTRAS
ncbi:hypothetical protein GCM10008111_29660 [Alishewanella tabrizica]|uniref:Uncharacterized protein n=1 Tax=Alishewanella tabrizica TaxID=671278 RepID=A0ABQ2WTY0_9ALTE|nr:hypothetical protein GCM10008111_29660 [Alishewanella tabrizica]